MYACMRARVHACVRAMGAHVRARVCFGSCAYVSGRPLICVLARTSPCVCIAPFFVRPRVPACERGGRGRRRSARGVNSWTRAQAWTRTCEGQCTAGRTCARTALRPASERALTVQGVVTVQPWCSDLQVLHGGLATGRGCTVAERVIALRCSAQHEVSMRAIHQRIVLPSVQRNNSQLAIVPLH